jgi:carbonic anhydrase/acetyltransferase-like protein (isoleucine patch superfamily)
VSSSELAGAALRRLAPGLARARRAAFVRRVQVLAAAAGATVDLHVPLDTVLGRRVRVVLAPGSSNVLRLGPEVSLGDDVLLQLDGGSIEVGGWSELRRGAVLKSSGRLRVGTATRIGAGSTLHCAHEVLVGDRVSTGEYVTLVDTSHAFTAPGRPALWDTVPGAVHVGDDCFLGAKATLTRSCRLGSYCVVGANSVVVGEVPDRTFVSGVPATVVRSVELPWE